MKRFLSTCLVAVLSFATLALRANARPQDKDAKPAASDAKPATPAPSAEVPKEESSVTDHTIKIGGQTIPYKATASTIMLKNDKGEPIALIFSVAYTRSDVKDLSQRPIAFLYNGGPGSSTIWLHMGAFGPRRVITADAANTPPPPYKLVDNQDSLLDKTDLVFIDAIGTGFSRAVGKSENKDFWGVDQDVKAFAQFINIYVTRNNRWNSPKFLIGESYGTFRSAALGNYLQSHDSMYLNGIVLISSVLDLNTLLFNVGQDAPYIYYLPSYAATAWYHKTLKDRPDDLQSFVAEARQYALGDYASALLKGSTLSDAEKSAVAKKLSYFTGLSEDYLTKADLRVTLAQFMIELQRSRGLTIGRIDARFSGYTYDLLSENAETDPQGSATAGPFVSLFNDYIRQDLKFGQDMTYVVESLAVNSGWDWKHGENGGDPTPPNTEGDLIQAMIANPYLSVQVENGYFDLATPFLATEYSVDHLFLPANLQSRIHLDYYTAGHMMYLHDADRAQLVHNIGGFIDSATKR